MKLLFDNIIFSLQKSGGISVVWKEMLIRFLNDSDFNLGFIEYENQNVFRKEFSINKNLLHNDSLSNIPLRIRRYINPTKIKEKCIFHSSYYRYIDDPRIANVTTIHDFTYNYFRKGLPKLIHNFQKGKAINKSQRIICVSENTKLDLLRFYPNINQSNIRVIYNGVSELYHTIQIKSDTVISSIIPFSTEEYVLFIGDRSSSYKNFSIAVDAASSIKRPLVIVGGGKLTEPEELYLNTKLGKNKYILLGNISNEFLNILYNYALCLVYPSSYEGFGIPIIEAQKAGCPVICVNSSSIPEVAGDGAIIASKVDANEIAYLIKTLIDSKSLRVDIINKGVENSNRFSWDKTYQQTKSLYVELYNDFF